MSGFEASGSSSPGSHTPGGKGQQPPLTEEQKKSNHIASGEFLRSNGTLYAVLLTHASRTEQKRREAIREAFDRLTDIVPGTKGLARSEHVVLANTCEHIVEQLVERQRLVEEMEKKGVKVDDEDKLFVQLDCFFVEARADMWLSWRVLRQLEKIRDPETGKLTIPRPTDNDRS